MQAIFLLKTLKIPSFTHSKSRSPHDGHQDPCYLSDLLSYSSPLALSTLGFFCSLNSGTVLLYSHDTENSRSSQMSAGKLLRPLKSHFVNKASKTLPLLPFIPFSDFLLM